MHPRTHTHTCVRCWLTHLLRLPIFDPFLSLIHSTEKISTQSSQWILSLSLLHTHTHSHKFHIFFTILLSVTCTANSKYKGHNLGGVYACVRVCITLKNEPISVKWLVIRMHWLIIASHYHLKVNGSWNQFCMCMCPRISICVCIDGIAPL